MRTLTIAAATYMVACMVPEMAPAAPDVANKAVLANLDRYDAYLRIGRTRREIKPRKASVLTPKSYPVTIEFWSGNTTAGWRKQMIARAGIYGFNFKKTGIALNCGFVM